LERLVLTTELTADTHRAVALQSWVEVVGPLCLCDGFALGDRDAHPFHVETLDLEHATA
jgi:hypothetical protein